MQVAIIFFALAAFVGAVEIQQSALLEPKFGAIQSNYANQPVIVVRKTTYYEPELVAVVVEKGVDDIPEETYMIQNYADVLGSSNHEIHLCDFHDNKDCLDKPVTKLLVPSLFKSIGESGFENFFEQAKDVPWVSTVNDNVELVKPVISQKASAVNEASYKIVSPSIFRYLPEVSAVQDYSTYPVSSPDIFRSQVSVSQGIPHARVVSETSVLPHNLAAGFAPLDHITSGGSILGGGATMRSTYQAGQGYINSPFSNIRRRRGYGYGFGY